MNLSHHLHELLLSCTYFFEVCSTGLIPHTFACLAFWRNKDGNPRIWLSYQRFRTFFSTIEVYMGLWCAYGGYSLALARLLRSLLVVYCEDNAFFNSNWVSGVRMVGKRKHRRKKGIMEHVAWHRSQGMIKTSTSTLSTSLMLFCSPTRCAFRKHRSNWQREKRGGWFFEIPYVSVSALPDTLAVWNQVEVQTFGSDSTPLCISNM